MLSIVRSRLPRLVARIFDRNTSRERRQLMRMWTSLDRTRVSIWENEAASSRIRESLANGEGDETLFSALSSLELTHLNLCYAYVRAVEEIILLTPNYSVDHLEHWVATRRILSPWQFQQFTALLPGPFGIQADLAHKIEQLEAKVREHNIPGTEKGRHEQDSDPRAAWGASPSRESS